MEILKKDVDRDILDNLGKIFTHEKKINEKIIEILRLNNALIR